jgi:hypothetical protein
VNPLALLSWLVAPAFAWPVAITVDDLPWAGAEPPGGHAEKAATVAAMVAVLRDAGAPAHGALVTALTTQQGLQLARVTIDNHEWKLAFLYADAKARGDAAAQARIAQAYTAHVRDAARHFRAVAQDKLGREPAHVLLLHANALLAEHGATMLAALAGDGATFISLEQALADPLYAQPDRYVGTGGVSWLYRVDPLTETWTWELQAWDRVVRPLEDAAP